MAAGPTGRRAPLPARDPAIAAGMATALFAVYALTAPRTVTLEDDGLFILAALDAGVAHPPGYPLFVLAGHLFSRLPLGTPAYRLHLMSALFGALACAVLYLLGRRMRAPAWAAAAAALGWGLSEHFWSQAIITEVYTLNALLCVATFHFCLRARGNGELDGRSLDLAALCFGLGLANHWPLTGLALAGFLLVLLPGRRRLPGHLPRLALIAGGVAALCYLWMWWRSRQPVTAFYGPIDDLRSFWFFVSRQGYAEVDRQPHRRRRGRAGLCLAVHPRAADAGDAGRRGARPAGPVLRAARRRPERGGGRRLDHLRARVCADPACSTSTTRSSRSPCSAPIR